jgi:crotonobetainyl-CoA:carnitine CoA-transferase CaiB-like acyl-CoA transferase
VPCGPINDIAHALADPQVAHRQMRLSVPHPLAGQVPLVASPIKMSATPPIYQHAPPRLGEHTDEVLLAVAGVSPEKLADLRRQRVI